MMESIEFRDLVFDFFGRKATQTSYSRSTLRWSGTIYETFRFECGLDGDHGTFAGGIQFAPDKFFTNFFDRSLSRNSDRESILENLKLVDDWCRLHLPDKFLERYESAIALPIDD